MEMPAIFQVNSFISIVRSKVNAALLKKKIFFKKIITAN